MIFRESATLIILVTAAVFGAIGYVSHYFLGDDNQVEETCEQVIKAGAGVDIDLSPNSTEKVYTVQSDPSSDEQTDPVVENNQ